MHNETEGYGVVLKEGYGVIPFRNDSAGRRRKIVFTPKSITVELVDDNTDVTRSLTLEEGHDVVEAVRKASGWASKQVQDEVQPEGGTPVVVISEAMVDACYNHPEKVPLPGKRMMRSTLERALRLAKVVVVDLPYLHLHARLASVYLMKTKTHLGHRWTSALDEALNHVDYVRTALEPHVSNEPIEPPPNYKRLFEAAMHHLRVVSGSRNSFTSDATARLWDMDQPQINLRTPQVEALHHEAAAWLKQHEYLIQQNQSNDEQEEN